SEHQDPIREPMSVCLLNKITVIVACADGTSQYLTAYKHSKPHPATPIRERVGKTPDALLYGTSVTSIPSVNKVDVETLRASIAVRPYFSFPPSDRTCQPYGFAKIAQVAGLKDAFERPF
ncbi:hypothetical protein H4582DRAFT_1787662, partial [Lactarius indigo]